MSLRLSCETRQSGGAKSVMHMIAVLAGEELPFRIKPLLESKSLVNDVEQFTLVNEYLASRPVGLSEDLMKIYQSVEPTLTDFSIRNDNRILAININKALDLLDIEDIVLFLKERPLNIPPKIPEEYVESLNYKTKGSRAQTYVKEDYIQLAALIMVIKLISIPMAGAARLLDYTTTKSFLHMTVYGLFRNHKIFESEPAVKLSAYMGKIVDKAQEQSAINVKRVIEKGVPEDMLHMWLLSIIVTSKLPALSIVGDTVNGNIASIIFHAANDKMKLSSNIKNTIREKKPGTAVDDKDKESPFESYRAVTKVSVGIQLEIDHYITDLPRCLRWYQIDAPSDRLMKEVVDGFKHTSRSEPNDGIHRIIRLISVIAFDPRMLDYMRVENMPNLYAVTWFWLQKHGFRDIAHIITGAIVRDSSFVTSRHNNTKDTEIAKRLAAIAPNERAAGGSNTSTVIETEISDIYKFLNKENLASGHSIELLTKYTDLEVLPTKVIVLREYRNLKTRLGELILKIDEVR